MEEEIKLVIDVNDEEYDIDCSKETTDDGITYIIPITYEKDPNFDYSPTIIELLESDGFATIELDVNKGITVLNSKGECERILTFNNNFTGNKILEIIKKLLFTLS